MLQDKLREQLGACEQKHTIQLSLIMNTNYHVDRFDTLGTTQMLHNKSRPATPSGKSHITYNSLLINCRKMWT